MRRLLATVALLAASAHAQDHSGHHMPAADSHAGHAMPGDAKGTGTDRKPGAAPAPAAPTDRQADLYWSPAAMAAARERLHREHGGMTVAMLMLDILEVQPERGGDVFRWDGEGWIDGDRHRFVLKSEGEGVFGDGVGEAEVQALYARALDPYWNLQAGVRQDVQPGPSRTYATVGVEGLAPYWFEVEAALFLSDKGDLFGRIEAYYDQRLTQRLILQPRAEIEVAAQSAADNRVGRGLSQTSLDLRLRYEIAREFAPYVGVAWERRFGRTAALARAAGEQRGATRLALGVRAWF